MSCSSTDELGILLSLRTTKRHSPNSGLKAENYSVLGFIPATRPCCWNTGTQSSVNSLVDRSMSSSLACKGSVPGEELASLILLEWQTGVQIHVLICMSFLCKERWSYCLDIFYHIGLCGISRDAYGRLWMWHWKVNNQCTERYHFPIALVRSVCKGFSVMLECVGRPSQAVIRACNWSGPMQEIIWQGSEFLLLWVCMFVWSRSKVNGPFSWLY